MNDRRKKFATGQISHSATHHLLAVSGLIEERGYARVSDIAKRLDITRGTVSVAMQSLKTAGYVDQDEGHFFHLTQAGLKAVASIQARHEVVEYFLTEVLSLSTRQAHRESCRIEYLIEVATTRRLFALLKFWRASHLQEAFSNEVADECPACNGDDVQRCACCGMECLEDKCSLVASPTA